MELQYTADMVRTHVSFSSHVYLAKLMQGQSPNWSCDQRTKDIFMLHQFLMEELNVLNLARMDQQDRLDTQNWFNRKSRATEDLYQLAADALNMFVSGKIERFHRK